MNYIAANILLCASVMLLMFGLAGYAWTQRDVRGARWFAGMTLCIGWVAGWYLFQAAADRDLARYLTYTKLEYIGLTLVPLCWLGVARSMGSKERPLSRRSIGLLLVVPVVTMLLQFTNELHGLIYVVPRFDYATTPPTFTPVYGAAFWVYVVYSYGVFLAGSYTLVRSALGAWQTYRVQAVLLLAASAMPWLGNLIEIFDLPFFPGLYVNALFTAAFALLLAFALFPLRLFDVLSLAHETILNSVPGGIVVVDARDRVVAFNPAVRRVLRLTDQALGQPLMQVFAAYAEDIRLLHERQTPVELTVGELIVEARETPIFDHLQRERGRLYVLTNVTERVRAERQTAALAAHNAQMASELQARNDELEALYQRVSRLEQLKTDMIQLAAHDLKNPLAVVFGYLSLLDTDDDYSREDLTRIVTAMMRSVQRIDQIVHDILSLNRIEQLAQHGYRAQFDLTAVARRAVSEFFERAEGRGQQLTLLSAPPLYTTGDEIQIYEAAANLVSNAIKYTPHGGSITVSVEQLGDDLLLKVRDTGIGIAPAALTHLFEPFYRVRTRETQEIDGTGLGLHLVKNIIDRHQGVLVVESVEGEGSTFGFSLRAVTHSPASTDSSSQTMEMTVLSTSSIDDTAEADRAVLLASSMSARRPPEDDETLPLHPEQR